MQNIFKALFSVTNSNLACIHPMHSPKVNSQSGFYCFVCEQSIVFHKAAIQNVYNVYYFKTSSMGIFNAVKKLSGIGFMVDALFDYFTYPHSLYTVVELHTNFVLIHFESQHSSIIEQNSRKTLWMQPICNQCIQIWATIMVFSFLPKNAHFF